MFLKSRFLRLVRNLQFLFRKIRENPSFDEDNTDSQEVLDNVIIRVLAREYLETIKVGFLIWTCLSCSHCSTLFIVGKISSFVYVQKGFIVKISSIVSGAEPDSLVFDEQSVEFTSAILTVFLRLLNCIEANSKI